MSNVRTPLSAPSPQLPELTPSPQPSSDAPSSALYGATTGGGLGSSDVVKSLPKSTGGEGLTRAELEDKKRKEAEEQAQK